MIEAYITKLTVPTGAATVEWQRFRRGGGQSATLVVIWRTDKGEVVSETSFVLQPLPFSHLGEDATTPTRPA